MTDLTFSSFEGVSRRWRLRGGYGRNRSGTLAAEDLLHAPPDQLVVARARREFRPDDRHPDHHLFQRVAPDDVAWRLHGAFDPSRGACSLVEDADGRSVLCIDEVTSRGRMIVTSLDPFYHHGRISCLRPHTASYPG